MLADTALKHRPYLFLEICLWVVKKEQSQQDAQQGSLWSRSLGFCGRHGQGEVLKEAFYQSQHQKITPKQES